MVGTISDWNTCRTLQRGKRRKRTPRSVYSPRRWEYLSMYEYQRVSVSLNKFIKKLFRWRVLLCHNLEPHQSQSNLPIVTLILIVTVHNLSALSGFLSIYLPVEILVSSLADTVTCDHRSLRHICRTAFLSLSLSPWSVWRDVSGAVSPALPLPPRHDCDRPDRLDWGSLGSLPTRTLITDKQD